MTLEIEKDVLAPGSNAIPVEKPQSKLTRGHIPVLDGLRGVAILMVLGVHFYQGAFFYANYPKLGVVLGRLASPGRYGVELFFML